MGIEEHQIPLKEGQEITEWYPIWEKIQTDYQLIRFYETEKQELILTLDTFVQFIEGENEQVYHRHLIEPALAINPNPDKILILGGGDGLAARTIFQHKPDADITLVELDGKMIDLFKTHPRLVELNENSLPKCTIYIENALYWVPRNAPKSFDLIICDFPDPTNKVLKKLYNETFLSEIAYLLEEKGVISIQCNETITDQVSESIKKILGSSAVIEYEMPCLDCGTMVIGRKQ